jgi:ATP-dependent Clp endopeptidase proteolytic subunit ClpP
MHFYSAMQKMWIVNKLSDAKAEILLYGFIYDVCASEFVKELQALEKQYTNIDVRINSGGGDVFDGMAIFNAMRRSPAIINTYCDGLAASMGSIVLQGGRKRFVSKVSQVMTHKPSAGGYGNSEELRNMADLADSMEDMMAAIYASRTGKTKDDCKKLFMNGTDKWFTADESVEAGLADERYDAEDLVLPLIAAHNEEQIWKGYNELRFAAKFIPSQNTNDNMKDLKLSAASIAALNLSDNAEASAVDSAITALAARAARFDVAEAARIKAISDLDEFKKTGAKAKVKEMLVVAMNVDKKITKETHDKLQAKYEADPEGLKEILDLLPKTETITGKLKTDGSDKTKALLEMSWEDLDKSGKLEKLKAENLGAYHDKFEEQFGKKHPQDKR